MIEGRLLITAWLAPGDIVYAFAGILPGRLKGDIVACEVVNVRVGKDLIIRYYIRPVITPEGRKRLHIIASQSAVGITIFQSKEEAKSKFKEFMKERKSENENQT